MTGYGSASGEHGDFAVTAEVRTVNHRFLDLHVRVSKEYAYLEAAIQKALRERLARGRVEATVGIQSTRPPECRIDRAAARSYVEAARSLRNELELDGDLTLDTLLGLPGVVLGREPGERESDEALLALVLESLARAVAGVLEMREREGAALRADLEQNLEAIRGRTAAIRRVAPAVAAEHRARLEARLQELLPPAAIDPQRLAQEVALLAERSDVSEEVARLESHLEQFSGCLRDGREAGKKLDFLLQEMHREANTVLSKSGNLELTQAGIGIKADIEKLREQAQNVE
jgi:uncharacterized protein (TIGR00255 family)